MSEKENVRLAGWKPVQGCLTAEKTNLAGSVWHFIFFAVYAAVLLYFCSENSLFFKYQTGSDVNIYMDVGRAVSNGAVLYRDIFEQKGPALLLFFAFLAKISPHTLTGLYVFQSLTLGLSLSYLYRTSKLFLTETVSLGLCLIFPVFVLNYQVYQAGGGSPEELVLPCFMGGVYFLVRYFLQETDRKQKTVKPSGFFLQGVFAGIILLVKINLTAFFLVGIGMILLWLLLQKKWSLFFKASAWFATGVFVSVLPCLIYMTVTHSFSDFWSVYIQFNSTYASPAMNNENQSFLGATAVAGMLNLPAAIILVYGFFAVRGKLIRFSRFGELTYYLTCAALVTMTYIGGRAYHYYIIPILSFTGVGAIGFCLLWQKYWRSRKLRKTLRRNTPYTIRPVWVGAVTAGVMILIILSNGLLYDSPYINQQKTGAEHISETILSAWDKDGKTGDPNILLYGSGDQGFYTLTGTYPKLRIFHMVHIDLTAYPDLINIQKAYVEEGLPDFVICSGYQKPLEVSIPGLNPAYNLIGQQVQHIAGQDYFMSAYQKTK